MKTKQLNAGEFPVAHSESTTLSRPALKLTPYLSNPSQEFVSTDRKLTSWDNGCFWDNCFWDNCFWSNSSSVSSSITSSETLGKIIKIRHDNERVGFVQDMRNSVVFYADSETINTLISLLDKPINRVKIEYPEIFEALDSVELRR